MKSVKSLEILIHDKKNVLKNFHTEEDDYLIYVDEKLYSLYYLYKEENLDNIAAYVFKSVANKAFEQDNNFIYDSNSTVVNIFPKKYDYNLYSLMEILTDLYDSGLVRIEEKENLLNIVLWLKELVTSYVGFFDNTLAEYRIRIETDD